MTLEVGNPVCTHVWSRSDSSLSAEQSLYGAFPFRYRGPFTTLYTARRHLPFGFSIAWPRARRLVEVGRTAHLVSVLQVGNLPPDRRRRLRVVELGGGDLRLLVYVDGLLVLAHGVPVFALRAQRLAHLLFGLGVVRQHLVEHLHRLVQRHRTQQAEVVQRAHVQDKISVKVLLEQLFALELQEHLAGNRDLEVADVVVLHHVEVPHLHELLLAFVDVSELVDHHHRLLLQPQRVRLVLRVDIQLVGVHGQASDRVVVQPGRTRLTLTCIKYKVRQRTTKVGKNKVPIVSCDIRPLGFEQFGVVKLEELGEAMLEVATLGARTPHQYMREGGAARRTGAGAT